VQQYPLDRQPSTSAPRFDGTQACAGADVALFFPTAGARSRAAIRTAKSLCAGCRFLEPCLNYAVHAQGVPGVYVAGVWGGTTQRERLELRRSSGTLRPPVAVAA
jgi:hypothetical protein